MPRHRFANRELQQRQCNRHEYQRTDRQLDPDTGEVLDSEMTQIGTLVVDNVKEKIAYCSVDSGDGAAIQKGMTVFAMN